jgi:hypothetical protein
MRMLVPKAAFWRRHLSAADIFSTASHILPCSHLGPAADALREVAGSPVKDDDMGMGAVSSGTEQHAKNTPEKVGGSA